MIDRVLGVKGAQNKYAKEKRTTVVTCEIRSPKFLPRTTDQLSIGIKSAPCSMTSKRTLSYLH